MTTTIENVTGKQLRALKTEAEAAGDEKQVAICWAALNGKPCAIAACVQAINAVEAMVEPERKPTAFDKYRSERRRSPAFEAEYQAELERLRK